MNKLVRVLVITVVILGIVSGYLFYLSASVLNSELRSQNDEIQNLLKGVQNHNSQLENQITELQNQISELQNQNSDLENQILELEGQITEIKRLTANLTITSLSINHPALVVFNYAQWSFNVSIQNTGNSNVVGARLNVVMLSGNDNYFWNVAEQLETLRAGEETTISMGADSGLNGYLAYISARYVATLMLDDLVLDKYILH